MTTEEVIEMLTEVKACAKCGEVKRLLKGAHASGWCYACKQSYRAQYQAECNASYWFGPR